MDAPAPPPPLLRNRDLLLFLTGRIANTMAVQALTVAVGWHVYQASHDPVDLGLVGLAQFAPALALFLVSGWASDRFDRRTILVACNAVHVVAVGLLILILWQDRQAIWAVLAVLVVHGAARSFLHTASQAILPNLVPRAQFPTAVAYSSSALKAAQLAGPALGGVLLAWIGDGVYWVTLVLFVLAGATFAAIRARLKVPTPEPFGLAMILGGFSYVWANKLVLGTISIDLLAVLFGGVMGLLPVFASDILHVGPDGLGLMRAMPGVGSLVVGLLLTQIASPRHMGPAFFVAMTVFGVSIVVFSLSETFWLSLLALGLYGASDMVSVYIRQTLVQIATPDGMRGRVSAVNSVAINASNELGDFRAGMMAGGIGSVPSVLLGGVVTVAVTAIWWRLFPSIRRVDRLDDLIGR